MKYIYISLILRKHYTPRAPAREVQRRPQNFGKFRTKNEQQRMYSSKMCHIYVSSSEISVHEISGNLGPKNFAAPQNFRKFRTKKKAFDFLWFSCRVAFHVAGLYVRHVGRVHGWCLFLALNFWKFWTKIWPGQSKKNCRRVKALALEPIGLGLDSRLQRALLSAGWFCEWLLAGCVPLRLCGWLAGLLWGCLCSWPAMWLAALQLGGCDWFAHWRHGWLIAGWAAGCLHG